MDGSCICAGVGGAYGMPPAFFCVIPHFFVILFTISRFCDIIYVAENKNTEECYEKICCTDIYACDI